MLDDATVDDDFTIVTTEVLDDGIANGLAFWVNSAIPIALANATTAMRTTPAINIFFIF